MIDRFLIFYSRGNVRSEYATLCIFVLSFVSCKSCQKKHVNPVNHVIKLFILS